jgi:CheY-like chemotaxis protein
LGPSRPAGFAGPSSPERRLVYGFRSRAGFFKRGAQKPGARGLPHQSSGGLAHTPIAGLQPASGASTEGARPERHRHGLRQDAPKEQAWASPPFWRLSSKAAALSVATRNRARERPSTCSFQLPPRRWTRERGRPEALTRRPKGSEVILLVEDEDIVRVLARRVLEEMGYEVHEACNGREGYGLAGKSCSCPAIPRTSS